MQWTLKQLVAQAALALSDLSIDQDSGRVSDIPTARTIRYYTTHGLLDKPLDFRGRTALYGQKHLVQLVAIKRLQRLGLTLGEIQARLAGLDLSALNTIARLPEVTAESAALDEETGAEDVPFWSHVPALVDVTDEPGGDAFAEDVSDVQAPGVLQGAMLTQDVMVMLQAPRRPIDVEDLDAIRAAAQPLLELLRKRRLID